MPLLSSLLASAVLASTKPDISGVQAQHPPKIDGTVHDDEWPVQSHHTGFYAGDTGQKVDQKAEYWLTYDREAIYFAGRVFQNPNTVIDQEYRQNVSLSGNDRMTLSIDPFGAGQSMNEFSVNAQGATQISLAGGRAAKTEWVGEFEAQGRRTPQGWEFEAKIPWGIMNLPAAGNRSVRMNVRWVSTAENATFFHVYSSNGTQGWPLWGPVDTPAPHKDRSLKLLPYAYGGVDENGKGITAAGLDARLPITDRVNAVGTINPDFRNIENSILSLDFSYFDRLASESRPFFLEGQRFRGIGSRLFATQKIQDIDLGLNVYGQLDDKRQISALTALDFGKSATVSASYVGQPDPSKFFSLNYIGHSEPGIDNHVYAAQANQQMGDYNFYEVARVSQDTLKKTGLSDSLGINYSHNGVDAGFQWETKAPAFVSRAGFWPENDYHWIQFYADKTRRYKSGPVSQFYTNVYAENLVHTDGSFYRNDANIYMNTTLRNGLFVDMLIDRPNFEGSSDQAFTTNVTYPATNPYNSITLSKTIAHYGEQDYRSTGIGIQYRPMRRVQASLTSQFVDYGGAGTQIIGSLRFDKGKYESFGIRLVRQDSDLNWTLSYRMSGKRGNEYFLVLGDPNARTFQRQLILKVVAPIRLS